MRSFTLVTGGAGFVGKHLVKKLRASGERVVSFDLETPAHQDDRQGSITNQREVIAAMQGASSVFHLAGNAKLWAPDERIFDEVNNLGTEIIANAALKTGAEKFIHCSSLTTLVGKNTTIGVSSADERVRLDPDDMLGSYPRSKLLAERAVEKTVQSGLNAVIVLPTEPLGPGDKNLTPPTQMILDFANGNTPAYIDCILNFVPVDSLADGLIAAREKGRPGGRYLLGGENIPMKRLLAEIGALTGRKMPTLKMPYSVALAAGLLDTKIISALSGKPPKAPLTGVRLAGRQVSFSSDKAKRELGWAAGDVKAALASTINWMKSSGLLNSV